MNLIGTFVLYCYYGLVQSGPTKPECEAMQACSPTHFVWPPVTQQNHPDPQDRVSVNRGHEISGRGGSRSGARQASSDLIHIKTIAFSNLSVAARTLGSMQGTI